MEVRCWDENDWIKLVEALTMATKNRGSGSDGDSS
jgi:hypothetical protein